MGIKPTKKLVAVQVTMVHREGDVETLKCVDIPVRDEALADVALDSDEWGVSLSLMVKNDPRYTIQYVIRDHQAVHEDGKLHPYCDGINSDTDMQILEERLRSVHVLEVHLLEEKIRRRDEALRKIRKELKAFEKG